MTTPDAMEELAARVSEALSAADLDAYRELLDPNVRWAAPDDDRYGCHSREEVLAWYRRGRASGVRADVTESIVHGDKILVGVRVHNDQVAVDEAASHDRWQVLTVVDGRIRDIRGFDDRAEAARRLGLTGEPDDLCRVSVTRRGVGARRRTTR